MTTLSTFTNRQTPIMPLPMPSYSYRYPNSDSQPYASFPDKVGIYNPTLPGTYQWETNYAEKTRNLTFLGPDFFKEPPKQYALSPNFPKENYSPLQINTQSTLSSKAYVPNFTNKTNQAWKNFLDERFDAKPLLKSNSDEMVQTGIGADFTQRPTMALRNNDGYRHASLYNINNWKPYGNTPAYFNNYVMGAPKFS